MQDYHYVIVTGCQRSGTTLVGQILGAHPNAVLIDETDGLYPDFFAMLSGEIDESGMIRSMIRDVVSKYRQDDARFRYDDPDTPSLAPHVTHLVFKAPNLAYSHAAIRRLARRVSVVLPVRDPRAVVASMARLERIPMVENQVRHLERHPEAAADFASELAELKSPDVPDHVKRAIVWRIKSSALDRFVEQGLSVYRFRYEDLVADPGTHCRLLADRVGLPASDEMQAHQNTYVGIGPGQTRRQRPVDTDSVVAWAAQLTVLQQEQVIETAGGLAAELGYEQRPYVPAADLDAPIVIAGRGGSGTRMLSQLARGCGIFLGTDINDSGDSIEWVETIYALATARLDERAGRSPGPPVDSRSPLRETASRILLRGDWRPGERWGWKLPETMLIIPDVIAEFERAKLVHLVRHPVTSSIRRPHMTSGVRNPIGRRVLEAAYAALGRDVGKIDTDPIFMRNAISWRFQVDAVSRIGFDILGPARYLVIRYEDMIEDPSVAVRRLAAFARVPLTDITLAVDPGRTNRDAMSTPEARVVWRLCAETAIPLGYEPPPAAA